MKYSVCTFTLPQCTPVEAARMVKDAGYDGIEWRCQEQPDTLPSAPHCLASNRATLDTKNWKTLAPEFRRIAEDHGLELPCIGTYCRGDAPDTFKIGIDIAHALGSPRFRIMSPWYTGKENYHDVFKRSRDGYAKAAELCKDAGLQALIELHMGNITPSASLGFRLVDGLDPRYIGIMHDAGNMVVEGYENWKLGCELLGPYLAYAHAKNARRNPTGITAGGAVQWMHGTCEMNAGFVDWPAVFKGFKAVGFNGWISNEETIATTGTTMERLRAGLEHLKHCETLASA